MLLLFALASFCQAQTDRALAYLAREVPGWRGPNKCFSCHNNGDGARALYIAIRLGKKVDPSVLRETADWLNTPGAWQAAGANPGISDKVLAAIQYAAALKEASPSGSKALREAAGVLIGYQGKDGSWSVDALGSPATYGAALATYLAQETLKAAGPLAFAGAIARAGQWLNALQPANVPEIAAVLLAGRNEPKLLLDMQNGDGGWGPWKHAPSEPFDTAIAILALMKRPEAAAAVARGRAFLLRGQQAAGGWPETTRPAGSQSYAQHISTSAWATIALLSTDSKGN